MKKGYFSLMLLIMGLSMASCQKCAECDCGFGVNSTICMDDFNSKDDYNSAVTTLQDIGCNCSEKLKGK